MSFLRSVLLVFNTIALSYFVLYLLSYAAKALFALGDIRTHALRVRTTRLEALGHERSTILPPVSLLAPAYNEESLVVEAVKSLLQSNYPQFEVILINDGSKDRTLERLIEAFELVPTTRSPYVRVQSKPVRAIYTSRRHPALVVIDKENGGKADALNAGLNVARYHLIACLDADSVLERDSMIRAVRPFLEDPNTVASSGVVRIANGCRVANGQVTEIGLSQRPLVIMQVLEYARAFFLSRVAFSEWNALPVISGAFGVFKRSVVADLGGFRTDTVAEDMELVMRIHDHHLKNRIPYRVAFVADPVAWTEAPERIGELAKQRSRWHRGLGQVLWRYRHMLLRPRYGVLGSLVLPFYWVFELLEPVMLVIGYVSMALSIYAGLTGWTSLLGLFGLVAGTNLIIGLVSLLYEEVSFGRYNKPTDILRAVLYSFTDPFWYRWLSVSWRMKGLWHLVTGKQHWGHVRRSAAWSRHNPDQMVMSRRLRRERKDGIAQ